MKMNNSVKLKFDEIIKAFDDIVNAENVTKVNEAIVIAVDKVAVNVAAINKEYSANPEDVCKIIHDYTYAIVSTASDIKVKYSISMAANAFTNAVIAFANPGIYSAYGAALTTADSSITEYRIDNIPPLGT